MNALVQENLSGARVVRAYAQETAEEQRFALANREYVARNKRLIRITGILHPGIGFLMGLGSLTVLWLGGRMVVAGRGDARRVRRLRRLPGDAQLADDRARLGGEPDRARRGVDGAHPRDPRPAARDPRRGAARRECRPRRGRVPRPELRLRRRAGAARHRAQGPGRHHGGDRRADRLRQEHARVAAAAARRSAARQRLRRRPRRAPASARHAARRDRLRAAGDLPVLGDAAGERGARRGRRGSRGVGRGNRPAREGRAGLPRGPRDPGGRARHHALGRAAAAHGARARARDRPAHPGPRRLALGGRHRDRGGDPRWACAR